jgi:hypothetical protein
MDAVLSNDGSHNKRVYRLMPIVNGDECYDARRNDAYRSSKRSGSGFEA